MPFPVFGQERKIKNYHETVGGGSCIFFQFFFQAFFFPFAFFKFLSLFRLLKKKHSRALASDLAPEKRAARQKKEDKRKEGHDPFPVPISHDGTKSKKKKMCPGFD